MMTLLTAFHPAHAFWIGLLIVFVDEPDLLAAAA